MQKKLGGQKRIMTAVPNMTLLEEDFIHDVLFDKTYVITNDTIIQYFEKIGEKIGENIDDCNYLFQVRKNFDIFVFSHINTYITLELAYIDGLIYCRPNSKIE